MKANLLAGAILSLALLAPTAARAETKVAVIDMTRAINETNEGARATLTLKSLFDKRQVELDGKQNGLLKEKAELEKRCRGGNARAECEKGMEELQKKLFDLQGLLGQYQQEIQKKQGEATQPIFQKMLRIVERLARSKGYDIVVDRTAAHYQKPELDLTELAITTYNGDTPNIPPLTPQEKAGLAQPQGQLGTKPGPTPPADKPKAPPPPAKKLGRVA